MRKTWVILILMGTLFFTLPGLVGATTFVEGFEYEYEFKNADDTVGAVVTVSFDTTTNPGDYTYFYQIRWVAFNPLSNVDMDVIGALYIPVLQPISNYYWGDDAGVLAGTQGPEPYPPPFDMVVKPGEIRATTNDETGQDYLAFFLPEALGDLETREYYGLVGEILVSPTMIVIDDAEPSISGLGTVADSGESITEYVLSGLITPGGGSGDPVPEPGTLFLLGGAMLCLAGARRMTNRNR